jgi:hypothetical protein
MTILAGILLSTQHADTLAPQNMKNEQALKASTIQLNVLSQQPMLRAVKFIKMPPLLLTSAIQLDVSVLSGLCTAWHMHAKSESPGCSLRHNLHRLHHSLPCT